MYTNNSATVHWFCLFVFRMPPRRLNNKPQEKYIHEWRQPTQCNDLLSTNRIRKILEDLGVVCLQNWRSLITAFGCPTAALVSYFLSPKVDKNSLVSLKQNVATKRKQTDTVSSVVCYWTATSTLSRLWNGYTNQSKFTCQILPTTCAFKQRKELIRVAYINSIPFLKQVLAIYISQCRNHNTSFRTDWWYWRRVQCCCLDAECQSREFTGATCIRS